MSKTTSEKRFKSFKDFTNLYELSKTLRFELKPQTEQTKEMLKQVIKDDSEKDNKRGFSYCE